MSRRRSASPIAAYACDAALMQTRRRFSTRCRTLTRYFSSRRAIPAPDAVGLHRVAIETAVGAGASRILDTSHQEAGLDSPFRPALVDATMLLLEALLADSGVAWTSLRNGFYTHTLDWLLGALARDRRHRGACRCPRVGGPSAMMPPGGGRA